MKVIVAGLPKTGTKTMQRALTDLGYNVYDYMENYEYLGADWKKIATKGGSADDFYRMYVNVDAITDMPGCYFWEDIHKAFPDAKIILTQRDSEDIWWKSFDSHVRKTFTPWTRRVMYYLSPSFHYALDFGDMMMIAVFGCPISRPFMKDAYLNEMLCRMTYRRHNTYICEKATKDKLLVYNVKQGWQPLCEFLEIPVPEQAFPHENKDGSAWQKMANTNPLLMRMKREMYVSMALLSLVIGFVVHRVFIS